MAIKGNPPVNVKVDTFLRSVAIVLKSAACEWLLLFFLLLDAAFSYFLTKFAQYCDLPLPCILCSRLDHIFEREDPDFYRNLLCNHHKSELSSLVLCQNHGKLSNVHETCEECLLSFAKKDPEMHKLLVGKLRLDCLQKPFLSMDTHMKSCSCCTKPWRSRPNVQMSVQSKLAGNVSKPDIPLPKSPVHKCLNRSEGLKKKKGQFGPSPLMAGQKESDFRPHAVYSKEKVISDSESDFHFSDDDVHQKIVRDEYRSHLGPNSPKRLYDDFFPPGLLHRTLDSSILMNSDDEPEKGETTTPTCLGTNGDGRHFFTEPNLQQHISSMKQPSPTSTLAELSSLDDVPLSSNAPEITTIVVPDGGDKVSHSKTIGPSGLSDRVSHNNVTAATNIQIPHGPSNEKWVDTKENGDVHHAARATNNWESVDLDIASTMLGKGPPPNDIRNELMSKPNSSAFDDLASTTNKHAQASTLLHPDPHVRTDCNGTTESSSNEAHVTSQTPPQSHPNHITTVNNGHVDDIPPQQMIDTPAPAPAPAPAPVPVVSSSSSSSPPSNPQIMEGPHIHESLRQKFGEANCEKLVNKLVRQLDYSTKCIENLYKELEEERNAASIAANQAMAMINKLQEEKAALNMESLQYLRMMEEQAEYDMEALDRANDMIAEKEREIDQLQADLDLFRIKYPDDFPEDQGIEDMELESEEIDESNMDTINFES